MPSLQASACITPRLIYIAPTATQITIVKSDSFHDADSVTPMATEVALVCTQCSLVAPHKWPHCLRTKLSVHCAHFFLCVCH